METRRDFLKRSAMLSGAGMFASMVGPIQRALAIDPEPGTTCLDAEHVVILMQENRSFDHSYGTLRGVRGFNDPRAVSLPNGNPVWLQTNAAGETYAPFRLDIKDTKSTWMSSLPHSWVDQTDARNHGKHDRWLDTKRSGHKEYAAMPLTLGFHNREDIPFYYALADAFTVCDQNFCSSLTGTTPNRLYLWSGTIRDRPSIMAKANVRNEDVDYGVEASWMTFPERLEDQGISWCIYQNELTVPSGFKQRGAEGWLANFGDNPIEYFKQYHVWLAATHLRYLRELEATLAAEVPKLEAAPATDANQKLLATRRASLEQTRQDLRERTAEHFAKLPRREQNLHRKAFRTNEGDPHYRELTTLTYKDGGVERTMQVPKGDVFHQFREDVSTGKLPTVSWIVAPENFSDHPGAPWYGAWYVSEVIDILARNPAVWKKTIFILCYDENDGYFDHVPPFVPPHPDRPESGKVSPDIDPSVEHVRIEQEQERQRKYPRAEGREGPIGLGYRVPLVIASPWSRGGYVCSEVFDHTSILRFLETLLSHKTGRAVRETNISQWRRSVCGNLMSSFRPYNGEKIEFPKFVEWESFAGTIHQAQFKQVPKGFKSFSAEEIAQARKDPRSVSALPGQEPGVRPSCALPYELAVDGRLSRDRKAFTIEFAAGNMLFGDRAAGSPFHVYAPGKTRARAGDAFEPGRTRAYAVSPGTKVSDRWNLADFESGEYQLRVHGPNGFFREFRGSANDPLLDADIAPIRKGASSFEMTLRLRNRDPKQQIIIRINDLSYGRAERQAALSPEGANDSTASIRIDLGGSFGWYDLRLQVEGVPQFERRLAGRIEIGKESFSDSLIGRAV